MVGRDLDIVSAGYIVNKDSKLLLIHHRKLDKWLPVGGHIEAGETPCECLRREILEEVGLEVDFVQYPNPRRGNNNEYPMPFYVNVHSIKGSHEHYCLFYLCRPKCTEVKAAERELSEYSWVSADDLHKLEPALNEGDLQTCLQAIELAGKQQA
jgi:8-oxo-dGTP pyrophosphatase MutT (NUDIX family)